MMKFLKLWDKVFKLETIVFNQTMNINDNSVLEMLNKLIAWWLLIIEIYMSDN